MASKTIPCITGAGTAGLSRYLGKSVEDFCAFGYGRVGDGENHCAHFVSHVLNLQSGALCSDQLEWNKTKATTTASVKGNEGAGMRGFRGASVRVNEVYNAIAGAAKGDWHTRPDPAADCLIYATVPENVDPARSTMRTMSKKHVGIHVAGMIWHYGNTPDKVRCDTVEAFKTLFTKLYGANVVLLWSRLPEVGDTCVHSGSP